MPHNPTAINPWSTAQEFNSGEAATSTQYNQIVNNLSLLYAKPWAQTVATVSTTVANSGALFVPGQSPTTTSNSPASAAGTISFGVVNTSFYGFTVPLSGMYRITLCVSLPLEATSTTYGGIIVGFGGASANNWQYGSRTTTTNSSVGTTSVQSFLVPMSATGTTGQFPTQVYFTMLTTTSQAISVSTPPSYINGTFAQIEYLGTSLGSI
jgi:hypothetical protein